jgi:hypothetical protein
VFAFVSPLPHCRTTTTHRPHTTLPHHDDASPAHRIAAPRRRIARTPHCRTTMPNGDGPSSAHHGVERDVPSRARAHAEGVPAAAGTSCSLHVLNAITAAPSPAAASKRERHVLPLSLETAWASPRGGGAALRTRSGPPGGIVRAGVRLLVCAAAPPGWSDLRRAARAAAWYRRLAGMAAGRTVWPGVGRRVRDTVRAASAASSARGVCPCARRPAGRRRRVEWALGSLWLGRGRRARHAHHQRV